jgi:hypothetical protein
MQKRRGEPSECTASWWGVSVATSRARAVLPLFEHEGGRGGGCCVSGRPSPCAPHSLTRAQVAEARALAAEARVADAEAKAAAAGLRAGAAESRVSELEAAAAVAAEQVRVLQAAAAVAAEQVRALQAAVEAAREEAAAAAERAAAAAQGGEAASQSLREEAAAARAKMESLQVRGALPPEHELRHTHLTRVPLWGLLGFVGLLARATGCVPRQGTAAGCAFGCHQLPHTEASLTRSRTHWQVETAAAKERSEREALAAAAATRETDAARREVGQANKAEMQVGRWRVGLSHRHAR